MVVKCKSCGKGVQVRASNSFDLVCDSCGSVIELSLKETESFNRESKKRIKNLTTKAQVKKALNDIYNDAETLLSRSESSEELRNAAENLNEAEHQKEISEIEIGEIDFNKDIAALKKECLDKALILEEVEREKTEKEEKSEKRLNLAATIASNIIGIPILIWIIYLIANGKVGSTFASINDWLSSVFDGIWNFIKGIFN